MNITGKSNISRGRGVPKLLGAWFFLFMFLGAAGLLLAREGALASLRENSTMPDPSWALNFPDEVKIQAAGEYASANQATLNVETFCALELEPSPTASFEVRPLGEASLRSIPLGTGSQIVFIDPIPSLQPNPDYDPSAETSSANFPYNRASGSITSYGWVDKEFGNVMVEGLVNTSPKDGGAESRQGLMARWDKGNNFYWFYVNFVTGKFGVVRSRFFGVYTDMEGSVGTVEDFDNMKPYSLAFTLEADSVWGEVYEVDSGGRRTKVVGSTGVLKDPDPQLHGVSGVLMEIAMEAPLVPLEGSFTALASTSLTGSDTPHSQPIPRVRPGVDNEMAIARFHLAEAYLSRGELEQAVANYEEALAANPEYVDALDSLAWIQATSNNQQVRNPEKAVEYAEQLVGLVHFGQFRRNDLSSGPRSYWSLEKKVRTLNTLAAAYASVGVFEPEGFPAMIESSETVPSQEGAAGAALPYARMALEVAKRLHEMGGVAGSDRLLAETERAFETFKQGLALYRKNPRR